MTYKELKSLRKSSSYEDYMNTLARLSEEELVETYKDLSVVMMSISSKELTTFDSIHRDVDFEIVRRWIEERILKEED